MLNFQKMTCLKLLLRNVEYEKSITSNGIDNIGIPIICIEYLQTKP